MAARSGGRAARTGASGASRASDRGREADHPRRVPRSGWRDVVVRTKREVAADDVGLVAAGVAFYALLSLVPALTAAVTLWGLVAEPAAVRETVDGLTAVPPDVRETLSSQVARLAEQSEGALGLALALGLLLALYGAGKGTKALMKALNVAFDEREERGFVRLNLVALGLTTAGVVTGLVALAVVAGAPAVLGGLGLGVAAKWAAAVASWAVLLAAFVGFLALVYRYGPDRARAEWRWVTPGALAATGLWLGASLLFTWYVSAFGEYQATYGALGGVVVLLLWLWLTAYVVIVGGELDAQAERQTRRDTTAGPERPLGRRGAYAADTVGRTP